MNVPKLRFKEFSDEWCETTLGETATFKQGIQVDVDKQFSKPFDNSVRFIRIVDYTQNTKDIRYISKPANANYVDEHDVVLVRYGATAGFVGHGIKGVIANNMFTVTPNSNINKDFLYTILKQDKIYNKLNSSNGSSAMPALNFGSVSILKFSYPSIDEQNKLTNLINLLDKKIELQTKKIEDLKLFKKGLHNQLFNEIDGEDYLLSDIAKFENGKGHENIVDENGNYILINSKFISTEGSVIKNCSEQLTPLYKDDITMVMSDLPNGKALAKCYYIEFDNKYSLNQRICRISIKDKEEFNPKYLFYTLNRNPYYLKFDDGVNQTNLKKDDILNINLNIPDKTIQDKNANILTLIDKIINKELSKLDSLNSLKKGLMQRMFV